MTCECAEVHKLGAYTDTDTRPTREATGEILIRRDPERPSAGSRVRKIHCTAPRGGNGAERRRSCFRAEAVYAGSGTAEA